MRAIDWVRIPLLLFVLMTAVAAQAAERQAQILDMAGTVEVADPGSVVWRNPVLNEFLGPAERLRTGASSSCRLKTAEGHILILGADTKLVLNSLGPDTEIGLGLGSLRSKVTKLENTQRYSIQSPTAVATVRGTWFDVLVDAKGVTEIRVFEGVVNLRRLDQTYGGVDVSRKKRSRVAAGAFAQPPQALPENLVPNTPSEPPPAPETIDSTDSSNKKVPFGPNPPGGGSGPEASVNSRGAGSNMNSFVPGSVVNGPALENARDALFATVASAKLDDWLTNLQVQSLFQGGQVEIAPDGNVQRGPGGGSPGCHLNPDGPSGPAGGGGCGGGGPSGSGPTLP